jgi:hypothetical protein
MRASTGTDENVQVGEQLTMLETRFSILELRRADAQATV